MATACGRERVGIWFAVWAILILASCSQCEASIWHDIRDFFFPRRTCRTPECETIAKAIKHNQNITAKPCDDFYEFTCGGWIKANPVPANKTKISQFEIVSMRTDKRIRGILEKEDKEDDPESAKKARRIYRACLTSDNHASENMKVLLNKLAVWGGWPIATENWDESKFDWRELMVDLRLTNDLSTLMSLYVSVDRKNTTNTAIVITEGERKSFCYNPMVRDNEKALEDWIRKTAQKIAEATNQTVSQSQLSDDIREMTSLERRLCVAKKPNPARMGDLQRYNPMTLKELQNKTDSVTGTSGQLQWVPLIKKFLGGLHNDIDENFTVIMGDPEYVLRLNSALTNTTQRTLANYMLWEKIAFLHGEISEELRTFGYEYTQTVQDATGADPRWKTCVKYVNKNMRHAVGYEYVKLYFAEEDKKRAEELVTLVIQSFIEDMKTVDWMDDVTRAVAIEKARSMVLSIGYPDWYNEPNLEEYYKEYNVNDSHVANTENLKLTQNLQRAKMLNKPMEYSTLLDGPATVNAYYLVTNMIHIPAGIFQEPLYIKDRPAAMNYGGIGFVIGHELSHGFDVRGRGADKQGNLAQWWDKSTLDKFIAKMNCVKNQYEQYPLPQLKYKDIKVEKLEGVRTVSENMADMSGLHQAFNAYKKYIDQHGSERRLPGLEDYSPEQLFFIGFATVWCKSTTPQALIHEITEDFHSPAKYRVLIPLRNSQPFADAWNCKPSEGELSQKCTLW